MAQRALVVDDDDDIRRLVKRLLEGRGLEVVEAANGREALGRVFADRPDIVVLDVTMPEMDGWQTLERIREMSDMPVIMLTARDAEPEVVRGLQHGADDYITKPFGRQELAARVERHLKRRGADAGPAVRETYGDGFLAIDFAARSVQAAGEEVQLTPLEYRLLTVLVEHRGAVLSPDQLLELVWNDPFTAQSQVKLYVGYLRRKLGAAAEGGPIETVRGFGYRYRPPA